MERPLINAATADAPEAKAEDPSCRGSSGAEKTDGRRRRVRERSWVGRIILLLTMQEVSRRVIAEYIYKSLHQSSSCTLR